MSRFFSARHAQLRAYVPGEQPRGAQYLKLNTNESPYPVQADVVAAAAAEAGKLNLYSDPQCTALRQAAAQLYGVQPENVLAGNGSDEVLYLAFAAFADSEHPLAFADVTYGCYPVFANLLHIPTRILPLDDSLRVRAQDYCARGETLVLANPNAPTGGALALDKLEQIARTNPENVVIVDEAYVDFGAQSAVPLTAVYDNLLVVQTFSKSRSMAGARLGFAIGNAALIADMNTVRNSLNPYNVNRMTQAAGIAAIAGNAWYMKACQDIIRTREQTAARLAQLGFTVLPSKANFLFVRCTWCGGEALYRALKARGILVRHFDAPRIDDYCRITIGTPQQMDTLLQALQTLKSEEGGLHAQG